MDDPVLIQQPDRAISSKQHGEVFCKYLIIQFKDKFRAVIETFLAMKTISQEDRRSLADKFKELDKDNSGVL